MNLEETYGEIFERASLKMENLPAGEAWRYSIENSKTNMKEEDLKVLINLEKLLGKTDINGQLSELKLIDTFISKQIEDAKEEQKKNEKLYKSLGIIAGLVIAIILI